MSTPGTEMATVAAAAPGSHPLSASPPSPPSSSSSTTTTSPPTRGTSPAAPAAGSKAETDLPRAYLSYLDSLQEVWGDLPDLTITYERLAYEVDASAAACGDQVPTLATAAREWISSFNLLRDTSEDTPFRPLHPCSGVVRPGELTLVLAPPGHGRSVLLKSLAGRMVRDGKAFQGEVKWNGLTAAECARHNQQLGKMCAFVEQGDVHFPMLTVRETFKFALDNSNADSAMLGSAEFDARQAKKVDLMIELLGLKECADTVVGDTFLRGVSGGQKKRVTLGEMMIGQARALFLDEISTGLDAAATFDIVSALKKWTRVMRGSATVALLQPAPDVFAMFDNVILLRHGHVVFSGSQAQLHAHLAACNIVPNPHRDLADWIVEFLTDPPAVWKRDMQLRGKPNAVDSFREEQQAPAAANTSHSPEPLPGKKVQDNPGPAAVTAAELGTADCDGMEPHMVCIHIEHPSSDDESDESKQGSQRIVGASASFATAAANVMDRSRLKEQRIMSNSASAEAVLPRLPSPSELEANSPPTPSSSPLVPSTSPPPPSQTKVPPRKKKLGTIVSSKNVPLSTAALRRRYERSDIHQDILTEISDVNRQLRQRALVASKEPSAFTRAQFYEAQSRSLWHHTRTCLYRQWLFMIRSKTFVGPRLFQALFMGLVAGSLFWNIGTGLSDYSPRMGLVIFSMTFISLINMSEIPLASQFKLVIAKQVDAGFYSTFSYVVSVVLCHIPLAFLEVFIYTTCIYYMSGFNAGARGWWFMVLLLLSLNLYVSVTFRSIAYAMKNADVATNIAGPLTSITSLFAGFLILSHKIPDWLIWLYWLSPYSWGLRSAALTEFHSGRYPDPVDPVGQPNGLGDVYLDVLQITSDDAYQWAGFGYLFGVFVLFIFINGYLLSSRRYWLTSGTKRVPESEAEHHGIDEHGSNEIKVRLGEHSTSTAAAIAEKKQTEEANQLGFEKMDLTFTDLRYVVQVEEEDDAGVRRRRPRALLQGVNGYAKAGELTALMGSSGAGKTTLMDVIAGRKTEGVISGTIRVNGHPQTFPDFNRLMGYCEQTDIHVSQTTVREAVEFSAALRLPSTVSASARARFVDQILDDLELSKISHRQIGDENISGLSPGELKRVTIGVELAANPSFLFLDEPTSGLDSRAALIVLRVIRNITRRGRSVVCTIHQPSAELFAMFDRLLLLKSGGREVYFGPVGQDGVEVAKYFMQAPLDAQYYKPQLPPHVNVASWMLDVIGAGTSAKGLIAPYDEVYRSSPLRAHNIEELKHMVVPGPDSSPATFGTFYAASMRMQFHHVLLRLFTIYWRDVKYQTAKFQILLFMSFVFGFVYLGIDDSDEAGMTSKIGCVWAAIGFQSVMHASYSMPFVLRMRAVFYRERASNMYAASVYSTALGIVELPYLFILTLTFVTPMYFMIGFNADGKSFFHFVLVMFLTGLYFSYLGQLFSSLSPNMQVSDIFASMCLDLVHLFGGVLIQKAAMPSGWQWMYHINSMPKGIISILVQQFYCAEPTEGAIGAFETEEFLIPAGAPAVRAPSSCPSLFSVQQGNKVVTQWQFVSTYMSTGKGWEEYYVGWLVFMILIVRILVGLTVWKISHVKR